MSITRRRSLKRCGSRVLCSIRCEELQVVRSPKDIDVYLEVGKKRTFAGAIDWPGWCRSGHDEKSALQALVDHSPRYAKVLRVGKVEFQSFTNTSAFSIVERLKGNATTDFGAPGLAPSTDKQPTNEKELQRFEA